MKLSEAMDWAEDSAFRLREHVKEGQCLYSGDEAIVRLRAEVNRLTARLDAAQGALACIAGQLTDAEPDIAAPESTDDIIRAVERVIAQRYAHMIAGRIKRDADTVAVPRKLLLNLSDCAQSLSGLTGVGEERERFEGFARQGRNLAGDGARGEGE